MITFKLDKTCWACPEQYDVYLNGEQVGYLRLRHGSFRCDYPDCGGKTVFSAYPDGDGCFTEEERDPMLRKALAALKEELNIDEPFKYEITSSVYDDEEDF